MHSDLREDQSESIETEDRGDGDVVGVDDGAFLDEMTSIVDDAQIRDRGQMVDLKEIEGTEFREIMGDTDPKAAGSNATCYTSTEDDISTKAKGDGGPDDHEAKQSDYYRYDEERGDIEHRDDIDADVQEDFENKLDRKKRKKRKKPKRKKLKKKLLKRSLKLNLEALNDDQSHRVSAEITEPPISATSTGRMNQEIIQILTELPLILKQKSKKIMKQRMRKRLHPAMRRNESRKHIAKRKTGSAIGEDVSARSGRSTSTESHKTPRFLDSTVSFTLKEKEQILRHEHPNVALLAAQDLEKKAVSGRVGEEIKEKILRWKRKADQKQAALAKVTPYGQDDVKEFKMWIYGADWEHNL